MQTFFITFGKNHFHPVSGVPLCNHWIELIAENIESAIDKVWDIFGETWAYIHDIDEFDDQFYANGAYEIINYEGNSSRVQNV